MQDNEQYAAESAVAAQTDMSFDKFAELLGQKPAFIEKATAQAKKDVDVLKLLGVASKDIALSLGLTSQRKPRTAKPAIDPLAIPAKKKANGK